MDEPLVPVAEDVESIRGGQDHGVGTAPGFPGGIEIPPGGGDLRLQSGDFKLGPVFVLSHYTSNFAARAVLWYNIPDNFRDGTRPVGQNG
ncbi:MAG: hypothetical protein ACM3YE_07500 [Bacteroidota bacterium]